MTCSICARIRSILFGTLIVLDEEGNVLAGADPQAANAGNPHYTISARLDEMRSHGSKIAAWACVILTWISNRLGYPTKDHCADAMSGMPQSIKE